MNAYVLAGTVIALLVYLPLWKQITDPKGVVEQNIFTWILWGTLDVVVAATIIAQKGNYLLPVAYAVGSFVTARLIWCSPRCKARWTEFETLVILLVVLCMEIWLESGSTVATVASTLAMCVAGLPQLQDAYREPHKMPTAAYVGYLIANVLSVAGGKSWAIEERFYASGAGIFCLIIVLLSVRQYFPELPDIEET